jgi:hypothetical protein
MADRYLKHIPSGQVFIFAPPFSAQDDFVECANPAGDPFPELEPVVNPAPRRGRKAAADAAADTGGQELAIDAALSADASRNLPAGA